MNRIFAALLTASALLCAWTRMAPPAAAQDPANPRDPLWLQNAEHRWYNEQVQQGRPPATLLFGLDDRYSPGSYGMGTLDELQRLFAIDPNDPNEINWKALERKTLLSLPLMRSGNLLPLLLRPQGDLYSTYAKRLAAWQLDKLSHVTVPVGAIAVDTHVHTCYSHDSLADPVEMLKAGAARGLSGMAITDHDTMEGAWKALDALPKLIRDGKVPSTFFVIPGEEISSTEGHVIGLYLSHDIPPGMSAERTVEMIHEQGGIAIAAHPELRDGLGKLAATLPFDAVETENAAEDVQYAMDGRSSRGREAFYATVTKPHVGVSDAHDPRVVGTCYTLIDNCASTPEAVRAAILAGRTQAMARVNMVERSRLVRSGMPRMFFLLGSVFGSDSQGLGAWLKDATHADTARVTLLPHLGLYWSKRF